LDFFSIVVQTASLIPGTTAPRTTGRLRTLLLQHGLHVRRLADPRLNLPNRMSSVLAVMQVQLIFFGHLWVSGWVRLAHAAKPHRSRARATRR
jgi:hypothetical protein